MERKYALTRVARGDYVLPSNDAQTLWRIRSRLDGPTFGLDWKHDRLIWELSSIPMPAGGTIARESIDRQPWACVADFLATRREAIAEAMSREG